MKTLLFILFASVSAYGQMFTFGRQEIYLKAPDSVSVSEGFKLIRRILPLEQKSFTYYVIKDGKTYMRHNAPLNRIFVRTYLIENGKRKKALHF